MARVAVVALALLALLSVAHAVNPAVKKPAAKTAPKAKQQPLGKAPSIFDKNVKAAVAALAKKPNYKAFPQLFTIAFADPEIHILLQRKLTLLVPQDKVVNTFNMSKYTPVQLFHILTYHSLLNTYSSAPLNTLPANAKLPTSNKKYALIKTSPPKDKHITFKAGLAPKAPVATVIDTDLFISPTCVAHGIDKILIPPTV